MAAYAYKRVMFRPDFAETSASLEDGSAWWSRRASARARLRALVSTEGEAQR